MGATLCGEVQEENNKEHHEEWLVDSGASLHITHKKKDMTDVEEWDINVTVGNGKKSNHELKVSVKMKIQDGQTVKLTEVLYMPQAVRILLRVSRLVLKSPTTGAIQDKIIIKKSEVSITLDARKGQNKSMVFNLKAKIYAPEVQ